MSTKQVDQELHERLVKSLQLIDPLLQFLSKATGRTVVPLQSLRAVIPADKCTILEDIPYLEERGVLHMEVPNDLKSEIGAVLSGNDVEKDKKVLVGFPPALSDHFSGVDSDQSKVRKERTAGGLHGSTKAAAKRRMAALKKSFKTNKRQSKDKNDPTEAGERSNNNDGDDSAPNKVPDPPTIPRGLNPELLDGIVHSQKYQEYAVKEQHQKIKKSDTSTNSIGISKKAKEALKQLEEFFDSSRMKNKDGASAKSDTKSDTKETFVLPRQAAFAGSKPERGNRYAFLSRTHVDFIPNEIRDAFGLQLSDDGVEEHRSVAYTACDAHTGSLKRRKLYSHQAQAIEAALDGKHTLVCTGTGSGKSLCFLLPILADVMKSDMEPVADYSSGEASSLGTTAFIMFPTKALAQDQLTKLQDLLKSHPMMQKHIRPGIIDGDTPHKYRADIADQCNILLSNPDTLHAAILPQWKAIYRNLLARLRYVVIDELHTYEGAFGAHVSLVLSRLIRVSRVANCTSSCPQNGNGLVFIGCSATIGHPEEHFRLICPIAKTEDIKLLTADDDGSPCAVKVITFVLLLFCH